MCGRYVAPDIAAMERSWHFGGPRDGPFQRPIFNASPTQRLPVYRIDPERGPELVPLRWGLIPSWARDPAIGPKMINARGETVAERPAFRAAFKRRRCLVPMRGFYEWKKTASGKIPHYIQLMNSEVFGVAGLYECWPGLGAVEPIETFTIITTFANEMMAKLHDRMPVILAANDHAAWLDSKYENRDELQRLLKPYPADEMVAYPVSKRVNSPKNNDEDLIERVGPSLMKDGAGG